MTTKAESKKSWRVYLKGVENSGVKKNDKGKGKEVESGRKRKRVEEDDEDEYDRVEMQESGRAFVLAQIIKMDEILDGLVRENEELKKEVREMRRENMEDR